ncbi:MAG TPA: DUF350 domain-containing protein [Flavipsychrobacter sp.]|nr:DUF350 domain-containing protein [Flavipsychrobacter sp.]
MDYINLKYLVSSVIYSFLGVIILVLCFVFFEKITPENIRKEIFEKQNIALSIVSAAFIIAIAMIISSAIHG